MRTSIATSVTLTRAVARELLWGLRQVAREVEGWRTKAAAIPDPDLRADALSALERKRGNIDGAALFWTLPDRRNPDLLKVLVAYEVLADYLDCVSERGASLGIANGYQLHLALQHALDPAAELCDYYRHHHCDDDGGYLLALVNSCRAGCEKLPSYEPLRPFLARAASLSPVLALNHEPDPARRERELLRWAGPRWPAPGGEHSGTSWFERTAGASAWLTVLAMLALAAEPRRAARSQREVQQTYEAYLHWIAPAGAMLDSYGDIAEDLRNGDHSYIAHYPSIDVAVSRMSKLVRGARRDSRELPSGARHWLITACMVAFYLSKDSARTPTMRASTRTLRQAGGPLVEMLTPALWLWRAAYGQKSA
jgi:tetraprenyl-beta-curcumene synthase